jgi:uncharacterized membrane protein YhaH (DUF805 family)
MRIGRLGFVVGTAVMTLAGFGVGTLSEPVGAAPSANTLVMLGFVLVESALFTWRAHDFNRSFWQMFWIDATPFIGQFESLWLLVTTPGTDGMNSYGHPPPF